MADNFGLKIGLEGEKEFKKALADINQSFKVLGSEMQLVSSQFGKNEQCIDSLTAKNQVLERQIEAQKQKITTLRSALDNAAAAFGESDRRTQQWQIQLNKAEAALNDMERELSGNRQAIDELSSSMSEADSAAEGLADSVAEAGDAAEASGGKLDKLGGVAKGLGTALGAAIAAIGAAVVAGSAGARAPFRL